MTNQKPVQPDQKPKCIYDAGDDVAMPDCTRLKRKTYCGHKGTGQENCEYFKPVSIQKLTEFKRFGKYIVLKIDDVHQLDLTDQKILDQICSRVSWNRKQSGKKENSYVVVNEDEPYAEQVWKLIEQSQTGKSLSPEAPDEGLLTEKISSLLRIYEAGLRDISNQEQSTVRLMIREEGERNQVVRDILRLATPLIEGRARKDYDDELAEANLQIQMLRQRIDGELWYWQGDKEDHLESLTCPILITADALRALLGKTEGG